MERQSSPHSIRCNEYFNSQVKSMTTVQSFNSTLVSRKSPSKQVMFPIKRQTSKITVGTVGTAKKPQFFGGSSTRDLRSGLNSPTSDSSRTRNLLQNQIRKPLEDADHEEAFAEFESMSEMVGEDGLLWTNRSNDSPSMKNHRFLGSFNSTPKVANRRDNNRRDNPLAHSHAVADTNNTISLDSLVQIMAGDENIEIGGQLNINGQMFTLAPPRRISAATNANQRYDWQRQNSMEQGGIPSMSDEHDFDNVNVPNFNKPPMNEQSSTEAHPIMEFARTMQTASQSQNARLSRVISIPEPEETIRQAKNIAGQSMSSYFINFKGLEQTNMKINQNISEETLSAGVSNASPGTDSITLLKSSSKSPCLDFQLSLQDARKLEPATQINNFIQTVPEANTPAKEFDDDDEIQFKDNSPVAKDKIKILDQSPMAATHHAHEITKDLKSLDDNPDRRMSCVTITQLSAPVLGKIDFTKRKTKKKKLEIDIPLDRDSTGQAPVADGAEPATQTAPEEETKVAVLPPLEQPQVEADFPSITVGSLGKTGSKKKKKMKMKLNIQSDALAKVEENTGIPTVVLVGKPNPPSPTSQAMPELKLRSGESKKSVFDDFLNGLESDLSKKKDKKSRRKKKDEKVTVFSGAQNPARQQRLLQSDLDSVFETAQLRRSNSDNCRNKEELMPKRIILHKLQELKESFNYQLESTVTKSPESGINISFLHASPIFINGSNEAKTSLVALKFQDEKKAIVEAIKSSKKQINFTQSVATQKKFIDVIRNKPECLHISCHGFDQAERGMSLKQEDEIRNLLFETENGDGKLITQRELNKILKQAITNIQLVFVAACMSQFVGEIFQQCGVPHVICSQQGKSILDTAAISFANSFYSNLFSGKTICAAFKDAKNEVSFKFGDEEANRFQLLISKGKFKHSPKRCTHRFRCIDGNLVCKSVHIKYKSIRAKVQNFIPREIEFFKLVSCLQDESRLVHFRGLPGIGKTALTRNVLHYLSERKYFPGGIIYESLNNIKEAHAFLLRLRDRCVKFFKLTSDERYRMQQDLCTENQITEFMNNLFQDQLNHQELKKKKNFSESEKRFLLVLDNAEALIDNAGEDFRSLIGLFLDPCKQLKILIISRNELGQIQDVENISPLILPQLGSKQAVQFFMDLIGGERRAQIQTEEIVELILGQENYPVQKILPQAGSIQHPWPETHTKEFKTEFQQQIEALLNAEVSNYKVVEILAHHHLFYLLQGNPTSLSRAAYVFNDPFQSQVSTLLDLYKQVKQNDLTSEDEAPKSDDTRPKPRLNNESLEATTKMMIDLLPNQGVRDLLYFIGCLPAGVKREQLCEMWGQKEVEENLPILLRFNLLEVPDRRKEPRYEMSPVLYQFLYQDIEKESLAGFMREIIKYFVSQLKEFFGKTSLNLNLKEEDNSPSVRHMSDWKDSLIKSQDSFNFSENLKELQKGLHYNDKKQVFSHSNTFMANTFIQESQSKNFAIEVGNLDFCLKFLTSENPTESESPFDLKNGSSGSGVLNISGSANDSCKSGKGGSQSDVFTSTWNPSKTMDSLRQKDGKKDGLLFTQTLTSHNISKAKEVQNQRRLSILSESKHSSLESAKNNPQILVLQATSSSGQSKPKNESPVGSFNNQQQQQQSLKPMNSQLPRRQTYLNPKGSQLDVIQEFYNDGDHLNQTRNSQYTEESSSVVALNLPLHASHTENTLPFMKKQDSSPFGPAPFSPTGSPKDRLHGQGKKKFLQKAQSQELGPLEKPQLFHGGHMETALDKALGLGRDLVNSTLKDIGTGDLSRVNKIRQSINTANEFLIRGSAIEQTKFTRVDSLSLNPAVISSHNIYDSDENRSDTESDSSSSQAANSQSNFDGYQGNKNITIKSLHQNNNINVSPMNLNTDRKIEDDAGLESVREGSDFDEESMVDATELRKPNIEVLGCSDNNFDDSLGFNVALFSQQPKTERRNTVSHDGIGRSSNDLHNRKVIKDMSASVVNRSSGKSILFQKVGSAFKQKHSRVINKMKALDKSARFTISNRQRKCSVVHMPIKKQQHRVEPELIFESDAGSQWKNNEEMLLNGEFLIYVIANLYVMGDFQFAYMICSTDFEKVTGSYLFRGNFMRFKALAAEQIFVRNLDNDEGQVQCDLADFHIIPALYDAVQSAKQALETYKGRIEGEESGYKNEYGLGLAEFHLGYLYEKYSAQLCSLQQHSEGYEMFVGRMSGKQFKELAKNHFIAAYGHFSTMNHLMGMYLSKLYEAKLIAELDEGTLDKENLVQHTRSLATEHQKAYHRNVNKFGLSVHIPRQHGEEISLLVEIVDKNSRDPLFRERSTRMTKNMSTQEYNL